MADTETKQNPAEEIKTGAEPKLVKDETEKATTGVTEASTDAAASKSTEEKPAANTFGGMASQASGFATQAKDNVFSMFGGGPKKEKKEEDDVDEPSGSSKKQLGEVSSAYGTSNL